MSAQATVFSTPLCAPCERMKAYLRQRGVDFIVRDIMMDEEAALFLERKNIRTTPVLLLDGELIVGFDRERIDRLIGIRS